MAWIADSVEASSPDQPLSLYSNESTERLLRKERVKRQTIRSTSTSKLQASHHHHPDMLISKPFKPRPPAHPSPLGSRHPTSTTSSVRLQTSDLVSQIYHFDD